MSILAIKEVTTRQANAETRNLRTSLADALRARDAAQRVRDDAAASLQRAADLVEALRAVSERSAQTIACDVSERAKTIREALCSGFGVPRLPHVGEEASRAHQLKSQAALALASAEEAHATLAADLATAEAALATAQRAAHKAAASVVASVADKAALELISLERRAASLRRRLLGVGRRRAPHLPAFPIDATTHAILRGDMTPAFAHETEVDVAVWISLEKRLMDGETDAALE